MIRLAVPLCALITLACTAAPARADVYEFGANGVFQRIDPAPATAASLPAVVSPRRRDAVLGAITALAAAHRLDPALAEAIAWTESRLRPGAVSPRGAIGVMQLMPGTAVGLGVDPHDLAGNVAGGIALIAALMRRYNNDLVLALAAYNAGTAAVDRWHGVPPYRETRAYVAAVLDRLASRAMLGQ